ncbi:hypothetical protein [Mycobacterium paraseoulense]|uniref:Uncharacterized protein n=1 Tax=Mycobacterium paraseoulense TaxID=590652 RepID=A0A1X0IG39_9MYCO|nr:hypothetical protein [Mycobacterium paraseoulense]MCV7395731.1 hypothetical protein [Mycobacterium paraseoulense]ORB46004.1 hypothetical protein BST39_01580 [Mycobacterium paraseoulense]BBZ72127.1 hypothetical protein MPRS_32200 [Mycobacterium paraseoulense]
MRAEEGDETVNDYAVEGKQTLGRINASQRAGNRLGDVAQWFAKLWRGGRPAEDKPGTSG